jgi:hypothetical protein
MRITNLLPVKPHIRFPGITPHLRLPPGIRRDRRWATSRFPNGRAFWAVDARASSVHDALRLCQATSWLVRGGRLTATNNKY